RGTAPSHRTAGGALSMSWTPRRPRLSGRRGVEATSAPGTLRIRAGESPSHDPAALFAIPSITRLRPQPMIALIQRVTHAEVRVDDRVIGAIGRGILAQVGGQKGGDPADADRLLEKVLGYLIFPDAEGRMNLSLEDVNGGLLLV